MPYDLSNTLVIGVSSRALFALEAENDIFKSHGEIAYSKYQVEHEDEPLKPGVAFPLIKAVLQLNERFPGKNTTEVVLMSRNNPDTSLRIFKSCEEYGLKIERAALTSGASLAPYLKAFNVDLFLSAYPEDVQAAVDAGIAAALVLDSSTAYQADTDQIRIAFDGDAVVFSDEAEQLYQTDGLEAFLRSEKANARKPLPEGPFAKLLKMVSVLQAITRGQENPPIRTALVTARNSPAHERVIRTLREWNVRIDEAFFMGGVEKTAILEAFRPHMFFDDQDTHLQRSARAVPSAKVPLKTRRAKEANKAEEVTTGQQGEAEQLPLYIPKRSRRSRPQQTKKLEQQA